MLFRVLLILLFLAPPLYAFSEADLYKDFDAQLLTYDEKRFLQSALAFEGHYTALIDGEWGAGSQRALDGALADLGVGRPAPNWAVALLVFAT